MAGDGRASHIPQSLSHLEGLGEEIASQAHFTQAHRPSPKLVQGPGFGEPVAQAAGCL